MKDGHRELRTVYEYRNSASSHEDAWGNEKITQRDFIFRTTIRRKMFLIRDIPVCVSSHQKHCIKFQGQSHATQICAYFTAYKLIISFVLGVTELYNIYL